MSVVSGDEIGHWSGFEGGRTDNGEKEGGKIKEKG